MAFVTRAVLFGEGGGFFQILRDYLFKFGLRETVITKDSEHIRELVEKNFWPLVFVDSHEGGAFDSFAVFERLYSQKGFELIPFILIAPAEDRRFAVHAVGSGARGFIKRPLQPVETKPLLTSLIPATNDPWMELAGEITKRLLQRNWEGARAGLAKLATNAAWERHAEIGLLRCETLLGQYSRAEERIQRLLKKHKGDLRILCEAADYYRYSAQAYTALKILKVIGSQRVLMQRTWQEVCLSLELDELDNAAIVLSDLGKIEAYREVSAEGIAHLMLFMGLGDYIPNMIRTFPNLSKDFSTFSLKTGRTLV